MRILQVTEASGGGTLEVVRALSHGLGEAGHTVAVAYGRRPETPVHLRASVPASVETIALPWADRSLAANIAAARALRRLVGGWAPDVVHLHSSFAGAVGALALGRDRPKVYSPHGYAFARVGESRVRLEAFRAVEWLVARRCEVVGAVSEAEAQLARQALRAPRVEVLPNGIAAIDVVPARVPRGRAPLVVALGRIDAQRRPAETASILRRLADVAEVRWVGAAPAGEDAEVRAAGVPVTGWLDHDVALDQLARADVLVHWSSSDAAPLAILEALAYDVVVVASDIPANREILGAEQVVRRPHEAVRLARAVIADPSLRARLLAGQRTRRERWSAARMIARWLCLYEELAAAATPHAAPASPTRRHRHRPSGA